MVVYQFHWAESFLPFPIRWKPLPLQLIFCVLTAIRCCSFFRLSWFTLPFFTSFGRKRRIEQQWIHNLNIWIFKRCGSHTKSNPFAHIWCAFLMDIIHGHGWHRVTYIRFVALMTSTPKIGETILKWLLKWDCYRSIWRMENGEMRWIKHVCWNILNLTMLEIVSGRNDTSIFGPHTHISCDKSTRNNVCCLPAIFTIYRSKCGFNTIVKHVRWFYYTPVSWACINYSLTTQIISVYFSQSVDLSIRYICFVVKCSEPDMDPVVNRCTHNSIV